jgi:hypothetical protein
MGTSLQVAEAHEGTSLSFGREECAPAIRDPQRGPLRGAAHHRGSEVWGPALVAGGLPGVAMPVAPDPRCSAVSRSS